MALWFCDPGVVSVSVAVPRCLCCSGADLDWTPGAHQIPTALLNQAGQGKHKENFLGRDKGRKRSLTNYCHGQNRLGFGKLV